MNVQNTEAWNVFTERSEQSVSAVPVSLGRRCRSHNLQRLAELLVARRYCCRRRLPATGDLGSVMISLVVVTTYENPILDADPMPTLGPTAASAADADRAALHTTASGVPNEHVSRLRQWFCSCASTTITPTAERINWYGKQTNCCIGSTERLKRAPARALTLVTMDEAICSCFFDELGRCNGL